MGVSFLRENLWRFQVEDRKRESKIS